MRTRKNVSALLLAKFLLCLLFAANIVHANAIHEAPVIASSGTLKGTASFTDEGGSRYSKVDWEISYVFETTDTHLVMRFYNPRITVASDAVYLRMGKAYTKAQLGLSSWPENDQRPANMTVTVNIDYAGQTLVGASKCQGDGKCEVDQLLLLHGIKNLDISKLTITSVERMWYNGGPDDEVETIILQKEQASASSSNNKPENSSSPDSSSYQAGTGQISETPVTSTAENNYTPRVSSIEERYEAVGIDANEDYIGNTVSMATSFFSGLAADAQKRKAREQAYEAEQAAARERMYAAQRKKGNDLLQFYLPKAEQGDEFAIKTVLNTYNYLEKEAHDQDAQEKKMIFLTKMAYTNHNSFARSELEKINIEDGNTILRFKRENGKLARNAVIFSALAVPLGYYGIKNIGKYGNSDGAIEWRSVVGVGGLMSALLSGTWGVMNGVYAGRGAKDPVYRKALKRSELLKRLKDQEASVSFAPLYTPSTRTYALGLNMTF